MKYRMLTSEEMELFDEDFKYFLIANGVKNEEWILMNQQDVEKATKLVELFSDAVLDVVYKKINYLEYRNSNSCLVFQFRDEQINLISLTTKSKEIDLSSPVGIHDAIITNGSLLDIFKTSKKYTLPREEEIHKMIKKGCVNSSQEFWDALLEIIP